MVERAVSFNEKLLMLTANVLKLRHEPFEIAGREGEQEPVEGPIRGAHTFFCLA